MNRGGLHLEADWTKNRKPGFQYLPASLVERLNRFAQSGAALDLYSESSKGANNPVNTLHKPLLYVPSHTAREMDKDLVAAGIPKCTAEGKVDFHASRTAYLSLVVEAGASVKEAMILGRHSNPDLTMNTYARARDNRLAELTERVAKTIIPEEKCAICVLGPDDRVDAPNANLCNEKRLAPIERNGGGGIRTPVPRCFRTSFYMLSRLIEIRLIKRQTTGSQLGYFVRFSPKAGRKSRVRPACFVTPLSGPQTKPNRTGCQFRQPCATVSCQVRFIAG